MSFRVTRAYNFHFHWAHNRTVCPLETLEWESHPASPLAWLERACAKELPEQAALWISQN